MTAAFQSCAFQERPGFQADVCHAPPPPVPVQLGGAGYVSGSDVFRPDKYFRAFHRFLGFGWKDEARELKRLRALAREFAREARALEQFELLSSAALSELTEAKAYRYRRELAEAEERRQHLQAISDRLAHAEASYNELERQRKDILRQELEDEETAIMMLFMDD
jgi:hypothetical protein